jgi:hypothetical protein
MLKRSVNWQTLSMASDVDLASVLDENRLLLFSVVNLACPKNFTQLLISLLQYAFR